MANLSWILNGNDLGIKGGSSGDHPLLRRTARTSRQRVPGPGAEPVAGRQCCGQQPAGPCAVRWDRQCCSRKLVATLRSLFEALRASKASPLENPISMSRAT